MPLHQWMAEPKSTRGKLVVHVWINVGIIVKAIAASKWTDAEGIHKLGTCVPKGKIT